MFQFARFATHDLCIQSRLTLAGRVSPFGHLRIKACLPAPRSFSQASTPFIACNRQGIHHMHLFAWSHNLKGFEIQIIYVMVWPKPIHYLNLLHPKPISYRCLLALHPTKNALRRYNLTHYSTHQFTRDSKRQSHEFPWIAEYFTSSKLLKSIREHRFEATKRYIFPVSPTLTLQIQPLVKNQK